MQPQQQSPLAKPGKRDAPSSTNDDVNDRSRGPKRPKLRNTCSKCQALLDETEDVPREANPLPHTCVAPALVTMLNAPVSTSPPASVASAANALFTGVIDTTRKKRKANNNNDAHTPSPHPWTMPAVPDMPETERTLQDAPHARGYSNARPPFTTIETALAKLKEIQWQPPKLSTPLTDNLVLLYVREIYNALRDLTGFLDKIKQPEGAVQPGQVHFYDHRFIDRQAISEEDLWITAFAILAALIKLHEKGTTVRPTADATANPKYACEREWTFFKRKELVILALTLCKKLALDCVEDPDQVGRLIVLAPAHALQSRVASMRGNDAKAVEKKALKFNADKNDKKDAPTPAEQKKADAQAKAKQRTAAKAHADKLALMTNSPAGQPTYIHTNNWPVNRCTLFALSHGLISVPAADDRFYDYKSTAGLVYTDIFEDSAAAIAASGGPNAPATATTQTQDLLFGPQAPAAGKLDVAGTLANFDETWRDPNQQAGPTNGYTGAQETGINNGFAYPGLPPQSAYATQSHGHDMHPQAQQSGQSTSPNSPLTAETIRYTNEFMGYGEGINNAQQDPYAHLAGPEATTRMLPSTSGDTIGGQYDFALFPDRNDAGNADDQIAQDIERHEQYAAAVDNGEHPDWNLQAYNNFNLNDQQAPLPNFYAQVPTPTGLELMPEDEQFAAAFFAPGGPAFDDTQAPIDFTAQQAAPVNDNGVPLFDYEDLLDFGNMPVRDGENDWA